MIRRIHCETCDKTDRPQHPEDVALGWKRRRLEIRVKKPADHCLVVNGESHPVPMVCDCCNAALPDGTRAFAVTDWQEGRESEPLYWENEYRQIN